MLLCPVCDHMLEKMPHKGVLYLSCRICQTKIQASIQDYLIKTTSFNTELSEQVNEHYIDDPILPQKIVFCDTCGEKTHHKYIRHYRTLKISHIFCMKCRTISKIANSEK